jgi:hypothetical protein
MYDVRVQPVQLPCKTNLVQWVKAKLRIFAANGCVVWAFGLPGIVWLEQNGVVGCGVYVLQMLEQAVYVAPRAATPNTGIYNNVFG